jgi:hypothetical protein
MSLMTQRPLECPHCKNSQEVTVWDSVNVSLDPTLKEQLFHAQINAFSCKKCGKASFINTPLMYHDMSAQFCVQYYPPEALDDKGFFKQFNPDGTLAMPGVPEALVKQAAYLTRVHIVFDMSELVRYVMFRDRLASRG